MRTLALLLLLCSCVQPPAKVALNAPSAPSLTELPPDYGESFQAIGPLHWCGVLEMDKWLAGDFDFDGDVDVEDIEAFEACASGPGVAYAQSCERACRLADFDRDGDVDQADFAAIQRQMGRRR